MGTVTSSDGTRIAFDQSGIGPAIILVVGAFNDRSAGRRWLVSSNSTSPFSTMTGGDEARAVTPHLTPSTERSRILRAFDRARRRNCVHLRLFVGCDPGLRAAAYGSLPSRGWRYMTRRLRAPGQDSLLPNSRISSRRIGAATRSSFSRRRRWAFRIHRCPDAQRRSGRL